MTDIDRDHAGELCRECCESVHRALGPGLKRSTYVLALRRELSRRKIPFQWRATLPVFHRGVRLDAHHVIELCILGRVIVDVLAVTEVNELHRNALRSRLHLTGIPMGLITTYQSAHLVLSKVAVRYVGAFCLNPNRRDVAVRLRPDRGS